MTLVKYYSAFFSRLKAIEQKNKILYDRASYLLKELADNGHSLSNVNILKISMFLVGIC
jgi:hypothetical protein